MSKAVFNAMPVKLHTEAVDEAVPYDGCWSWVCDLGLSSSLWRQFCFVTLRVGPKDHEIILSVEDPLATVKPDYLLEVA